MFAQLSGLSYNKGEPLLIYVHDQLGSAFLAKVQHQAARR
jgi:hypothetical protein